MNKSKIKNVDARYKNVKETISTITSPKEKEFIKTLNVLKER